MTTSTEPVPVGSPAVPPKAPTHACVRCGAQCPLDVGLCERCNPLGLKDAASSQVHGTVVIALVVGIVALAIVARLTLAGVGPFPSTFVSATPDGDGLAVTLTVTNAGSNAGQTTCRITDPLDRNGNAGGFVLSPRIDPGATVTFTKRVAEFGSEVRVLDVACTTP